MIRLVVRDLGCIHEFDRIRFHQEDYRFVMRQDGCRYRSNHGVEFRLDERRILAQPVANGALVLALVNDVRFALS